MRERDLIVGVLAAQAGFVTPSEVLAAAAGGLVDSSTDSLLTRLEKTGALNAERRKALEALAEQALAARNGDARAVLTTIGAASGAIETLVSAVAAGGNGVESEARAAAPIPLERPGQYTRLQELGRGSQSVVRAARDEIVGREVALKELVAVAEPGKDESSRAAQARFLREVRLVAGLDHPGIVNILELARREDGTLFCAQKLIRGETLQVRLARCHSLADRLALLRHVLDACQAMGFAHSKKVIHRDLKPSNIMVGEYGETVVVDWGLAKHREEAEHVVPLIASSPEPGLTVAGVALGTPAYMSPEQARGDLPAIDARSDVFSLGAILYQLLTGRPPFEGATSDHVLENVRAGSFPPVPTLAPSAPPELAAIAEHALSLRPSERYGDAEELAKELSAYLTGGRVRAYRYGTWELLRKFAASHRALTAGVAVALGALIVAASAAVVRLQLVRRDLARAFIQRAQLAEAESDWAKAAGFFAAARTQRDTSEARWGIALAAERAPERILSLQGPPDSFREVSLLPDGRVVVLSTAAKRLEVRDLDGKVLWTRESEVNAANATFARHQVRIVRADGFAYLDGGTGLELGVFEKKTTACRGQVWPPQLTNRNGKLLGRWEGRPEVTLATDVTLSAPICGVSSDGLLAAYRDHAARVHLISLPDGRELAQGPGGAIRTFLFTRHGLILVRQGSLDSVGAPEGDFSIMLGERPFTLEPPVAGGVALSPDGEMVVVARVGSNSADVVDLRTRRLRAVLHYPDGWPSFTFSADGQRIFAAGLGAKAQLVGWSLARDPNPTGHPGSWAPAYADFFVTCCRLAIPDGAVTSLNIFGEDGGFLGRESIPSGKTYYYLAEDGMFGIYDYRNGELTLRDIEEHRDRWRRQALRDSLYQVSRNGTRLVLLSANDGFEAWDAATDRVLLRDKTPVGFAEGRAAISRDGERVAWTGGTVGHVADLGSGVEHLFALDALVDGIHFSNDGLKLAVVTRTTLSVWDARTGRRLLGVPHAGNDRVRDLRWSEDDREIYVSSPGEFAMTIFDARTGERLARFPGTFGLISVVRPDLRAMLVVSSSNWDLLPLPPPASDAPAEGLTRTLARLGLALDGPDIVAAP